MITPSIGGGARSFDSDLRQAMVSATTNAELTIRLSICLERVPAGTQADWNGTTFTTAAWPADAWAAWCRRFRDGAQSFWHGKFWLRTPDAFDELDVAVGAFTYRPNVWCRFRLTLVDTTVAAHRTIRVARIAAGQGAFRSDAEHYDQHDLGVTVVNVGGSVYRQRQYVHEVGHALGLDHIAEMTANPACTAAGSVGAWQCYGTSHAEFRDVMGIGMNLSAYDARPWVRRIAQHTGTAQTAWQVLQARIHPRRVTAAAPPAPARAVP